MLHFQLSFAVRNVLVRRKFPKSGSCHFHHRQNWLRLLLFPMRAVQG
jgi:hypothetical protein